MEIFDRNKIKTHLQRADNLWRKNPDAGHDFLWAHCAADLQDRLLDIRRDFGDVAEISARRMVLSPAFMQQKKFANTVHVAPFHPVADDADIITDDEFWPFAKQSLDAIVSLCHLHWVNDLPGTLAQYHQSLRPDGVFMAAFFGGETLQELRASLTQAEIEIYGGVSPRVSPFVTLPDMAALMQRAQFALPVVDHEIVTVNYSSFMKLVADLRGMGQTHAVLKRDRKTLSRAFWVRAEEIYRTQFANPDGKLQATFEIIYALGWSPDASQPKPLARGSATHDLQEFLNKKPL